MITVMFYYCQGQAESQDVEQFLAELRDILAFDLVKVDISTESSLSMAYGGRTPVVQIGPYILKNPIGRMDLEIALRSALDREAQLVKTGDRKHQLRKQRGHTFSEMDRFAYWLSRHYITVINSFLALFIGLAFLAPVFMKIGLEAPARAIYTVYSPLCHQLAFRSWFLFGEQAYYPRAIALISEENSYEQVFKLYGHVDETSDSFILDARFSVGDEQVGYKVALCQRDVAIYSSFLLFGILFSIRKRKIRSIRWILWLLLGVVPMAFDGLTQLPGLMAGLPDWLPLRESTPFLRTITGFLFGFSSAWYLYPFMEESMSETQAVLTTKKAVVEQTGQ